MAFPVSHKAAFIEVLNQILRDAKAKGISGKELARRAGITPETLSRMRSRGSGDFGVINEMAKIVGTRLALVPDHDTLQSIRDGTFF